MLASIFCLTQTLYYEARSEPVDGKLLVAEVVLNRIESEEFPDTVCEVVYQPNQFAWSDNLPEVKEPKEWGRALLLSVEVLSGTAELLNTEALYFHSGPPTNFFLTRELLGVYGNHTFYQ